MQEIAHGFDPHASPRIASLYDSCDDAGLPDIFAANLRSALNRRYDSGSPQDLEAIKRCRLLRKLPFDNAMAHWRAINRAWCGILDDLAPRTVISEAVDSYVIDSLQRECRRRGIPFLGLVTCFVDGYFRVTVRGEHRRVREPAEEEVEQVVRTLLDRSYKPQFVAADSGFTRKIFARWARNIARVVGLGMLSLVPKYRRINMVYGGFLTAREWLQAFPRTSLGRGDWKAACARSGKPIVYVPLQHAPEATIDYWCASVAHIDYENSLYELLRRYGNRFQFVLKEHPNVIGLRHPGFYSRLEDLPEVVFADAATPSNQIIDESDAVLVWTGSVGFEAALRGKPVLAVTPAYYMSGRQFLQLGETTPADEVAAFMQTTSSRPITQDEQKAMVRHLLSGLLAGRLAFSREFEKRREEYADPAAVGRQLRLAVDHGTSVR